MPINAFSAAMDSLFQDANLAVDANYTPSGGSVVAVRLIRTAPDKVEALGRPIHASTVLYSLRISDVAAPADGDRIEIPSTGEIRIVQGEPQRDEQNLSWVLDTRPETDV